MAAYIAQGVEAKHILGAVIMTAPGTMLIAKMLVPETEAPITAGRVEMAEIEGVRDRNILSAISRGTLDGLHLAVNVGAMLIAFLALIALVNGIFGWVHAYAGWFPETLQALLGYVFAPVAWLIGIAGQDIRAIGGLLGTRMVANELVAFQGLGQLKSTLDPRSFTIATYALCGFANLSSIGIQIGGIGALAPERRGDLAALGFKAMLAGTAANLVSACIVGVLV
jgi:CNT family concentrative nucleoside transporter